MKFDANMDTRPNDQKLFYWLLYNHREAQLENYNNNVPISKSDFHHLKPPNWGKRVSTCQFVKPGRNGHTRTVSRFTVISNVADVDDVGTVRSYDPYNASRVLQPCGSQVSHAKIIIHRSTPEPGLGPSPTSVSHLYRSYRSVNGSFRQRGATGSRRTSTTGQLRSPHTSMSSIRSQQSNPRVRANNRSKRSVDFSSVRNKGNHHRRNRHPSLAAPANVAGDDTAYDRDTASPSNATIDLDAHQVTTARSMMNVGDTTDDTFIWTEELEQLGHRIARDCDEAFRSSLLMSESGEVGADSRETSPFMLSLGTLPVVQERPASATGGRPWDNRPLPPVPSQTTISPLSIRKCDPSTGASSLPAKPYEPQSRPDVPVPERRVVSEPVYDRRGKDTRPLPSIYENTPDDRMRRNGGRHDVASSSLETPTRAKNKGLDFLARAENTIRVVNSPSAMGGDYPVKIPEPLNVRKVSRNAGAAKPAVVPSVQGAQRRASYGSQQKSQLTDGNGTDAGPSKKRVSSWFKRNSKENASGSSLATVTDSSVQSKDTLVDSQASQPNRPISQATDDTSLRHVQKKKSFGFAFWKGAKDDAKMSLAGKQTSVKDQAPFIC